MPGLRPACNGKPSLFAAVVILLVSFCATAQTLPEQDLTDFSLEQLASAKVFTASRHLEAASDAPSAVTVITAEEISRYGWRTLADVMRSLRGFYTTYDRDYTYLGVRGFLRSGDYNSRILVLINGHRINDNVYDSAPMGTEFPLDLDLIERIEVVRGPSSSLFGTNAVFGVINVITRRASPRQTIEVSGDSSSFLGRTGRVTASLQKHGVAALLSGSVYRSDGEEKLYFPEFAGVNHGIDEGGDWDRYAQFFGDVQYGGFRFQGLYSSRDKGIPTAAYGSVFNAPAFSQDRRGYADVSYNRILSTRTDLEFRGYYDLYDYRGGGLIEMGPGQSAQARGLASAGWVGGEVTVGHEFGRNRIVAGGNYEHNLDLNQENRVQGLPSTVLNSRQVWQTAVYADAEWKVTQKVSFRTGGRLDYFNAFGSHFSPRLAFIYSPSARTNWKYIYGEAFRAPNAYENDYVDGLVVERMPVPLKPETSTSHEIVLERTWRPWLTMSAGAFYENLRGLIDQVPDPATGLTYFANNGRDVGRGIEFELDVKTTSGWLARGSYTLAEGKDDVGGQHLANSPLSTAKLNGSAPLGRFGFGSVEMLYSSAEHSYRGERIPPWFLTNLTVSTRPMRGWEFSASGYNLFDRQWFSPAGLELRQSRLLQEGRSFRVKLSYRLSSGERGH